MHFFKLSFYSQEQLGCSAKHLLFSTEEKSHMGLVQHIESTITTVSYFICKSLRPLEYQHDQNCWITCTQSYTFLLTYEKPCKMWVSNKLDFCGTSQSWLYYIALYIFPPQ